ncbi:M20 metallopeptidase family protein [Paenibacillus turpanensis]|uniref:M20 metallopeptidase family protein n=1 Tax=Paenibacillus turpanensis TaxID=2689078 RepID=UPI00140A8503|nr:M20 family metallopeptidase [Paenibacillus turpanensis]
MTLSIGLDQWYPRMVEWRRHLHSNPELSYEEKETSAFIAKQLSDLGLEVATGVGGHGITALLRGAEQGPTIAFRADIDALPIQDEKDCEYKSKVPGVMHACGHDAHTAALLGTAAHLCSVRDRLKGNVKFIFQPAEEVSPGGALGMIRDGALEGVDAIYGVHLWTPFPVGTIQTKAGPFMAAADEFQITVQGKGGHGGLPNQTVDSIVTASHLVVNLQTIVSRNVDPTDPCVISIGSIHGGSAFNVIAEKTALIGTVRSFTAETRDLAERRLKEVVKASCEMQGATAEFEYKRGYPPVVNPQRETELAMQVARQTVGESNVMESPFIMAGEDFAYYLQQVPGCFVFVGAGSEKHVAPHHHPLFDIDEKAMLLSAQWFTRMAEAYLG